jgi:DNA-nicking Smr family endonuclease
MTRRAIDPDDIALWHAAMRGVARHRGAGKVKQEKHLEKISVVPAKAGTQDNPPSATLDSRVRGNDEKAPPGLEAGIDRRQALRLKRGQLPIEARLDLHGMTQAEAHRALASFVARNHAAGKRVLLVVTGKGTREGTGVLRAAVPRWLAEPALRERVLATASATPRDGGGGALYVLLRRAR